MLYLHTLKGTILYSGKWMIIHEKDEERERWREREIERGKEKLREGWREGGREERDREM